jgi:hypothetical protein
MYRDAKHAPSEKLNPQELWDEIVLTRSGIDQLLQQSEQTGDLKPVRAALDELQLKTSNYEKLLQEMQAPLRTILGTNFLGIDEWRRGLGVHVGAPPPIPEYITAELLQSMCPLHLRKLIKDTHVLMLVPRIVNGEPYSVVKLDELCTHKKGSGQKLIDDGFGIWREESWAKSPQVKSEWVLLPKTDPEMESISHTKYFREKDIPAQQKVLEEHYPDYRQAKALEVMTMAVLYDLLHRERVVRHWLRCEEPNNRGGRVLVGLFSRTGLKIRLTDRDEIDWQIGCSLVRKTG